MKRTLLTLFCTLLALAASADEGMWLPSLISQRIDDMRAKGFRLTAEDIYSINKASMKDAVVLFNGGCTGELISSEGMLLTNHHCGYDAIQAHSSVEHDYLTNGFWAMSRREELPNKELNVRFLVRMEEVTDRIAAGETKAEIIRRAEAESKGYKASVEQMYYGNQQFLFIYEQFDDVRLVGAPPSSIGKFGGDTDNWIWPRHTGDFSLFRIYAGKDNKPAAYSPENVPYRPKRHFTISTAGVEEGDFTMIYGFPGNTQEYILSDAVAYIAERSDPAKIAIRTGRLDIISAAQESDPALRIHYAAKHASIANAWKKWQGEALGIGRLGTVASKRAYEQEFAAWAQDKPEYRSVVADLKAEYARIADAYFAREITRETLGALPERYTPEERAEAAFARREQTERALFEWLFGQYARRCPVQYQIPAFLAGVAASGSPEAYAGEVFDTLWREGADTTAVHALHKDTERMLGHIGWMLETKSLRNLNSGRLNELYTTYIKGLREWDTLRAFYPDANLTLRVAYGHVGGYEYADGEYRQMSRDLSLDYISSSDNFLKRTLLEMTTNDLDKKRQSNGSYSVYSYLLRTPLTKAVDGTKPEVNHGVAKKKEYGFGIAGLMGVRFVDGNNQPTGEYGLVVTSVYPDSPASEAGFRRGTFFAQYNGAAITAANLNSVYGTLIAPGGASTVKLTENKQGAQPVSLTAREIYPNPVIHSEVITSGAHRIGYLVYDSFDAAYDDELLAAVKKLKDGNITDMVLDLRNNGGGHVISSNMLSTCIAGAACQGKVYEYYRYNDSRMATVEKTARETGKEYDTAAKKFFDEFYYGDYYGVDLRNYALNMTRLYVLVTGNTASSSEAVINTLRGLDGFTVKLIGEKTNGKNVGMEVSKFTVGNYSYELAPISFQGYNAKQVTVDKNGLAVDTACEEWDGELKDYGDRSEPMLAAALSQITGQRSASVSGTRSTAPGVRPATDIALPDLSNRPNGMIVFLPAAEE